MFDLSDEAWERAQEEMLGEEIRRLTGSASEAVLAHRPREAAASAREALALAESSGRIVPVDALLHLGYALSDLHENDAALDCYRIARDRFVIEGDVVDLAHVDMNIAIVEGHLGHHATAVEVLEGVAAVFADEGEQSQLNACWINLVPALRAVDRDHEAAEIARLSVESCRELGDRDRLAAALANLANGERDGGDRESARAAYIEALEIYRNLGLPTEEADCLDALGVIARLDGLFDFAASMHRRAIEMYEGRDHDVDQAIARYNLAVTELWRGDNTAALGLARSAATVSATVLDPAMVEASALDGLGRRSEAEVARAGFVERHGADVAADVLRRLP